jgi:hypothetical protein
MPSGKGAVTVPVVINGDIFNEGLETAIFQLQNPSANAELGTLTSTTLNITDEEPVVQLSAAAYNVSEPKGSTAGSVTITVKRLGNLSGSTSVTLTTSDLTADAGFDYDAVSVPVDFNSGASTRTVKIPIRPDADDEPDETFRVTLSGPVTGSLGAIVQADVTIKDNDTAGKLQLQAAVLSVDEAAGNAVLTVTRTGGTGVATVDYATASGGPTGGADSGTDFDVTVGTLSFAAGENSKTISVPITDDPTDEDGEFFTVTLASPGGGATLGTPTTATVWIVDND